MRKLRSLLRKIRPARSPELATLPAAERELIGRIRERHLTYLSDSRLASLAETCRSIEQKGLPGLVIEAGCALGGSAILLSFIKSDSRRFRVYDVFDMIPPPTAEDSQDVHDRYRTIAEGKATGIEGDRYYGYLDNLYDIVQSNFRALGVDLQKQNIELIKGLLQDTMHVDEPVALAHVDVDWYDPVKTCLERIIPRLVVGGSVILDDYRDWGGCRKATDEYLDRIVGQFRMDDSAGSVKLTRVRA